MTHKRFHRRPEVESLETMVLLSGFRGVEHGGVPAMAGPHAVADTAIVLLGSAKGTYKSGIGIGLANTFSAKGNLSPLGKITLKGSINYNAVNPTGTVTLSSAIRKHGKTTASLRTQGVFHPVFYTITGATGTYAGDTGSGEVLLSSTATRGRNGKVTMTFVQPAVS